VNERQLFQGGIYEITWFADEETTFKTDMAKSRDCLVNVAELLFMREGFRSFSSHKPRNRKDFLDDDVTSETLRSCEAD
jgi:hypothetical protein